MIRAVWCHQQRVLLYGQQADPTPQSVQTSVPQGDAWSLYGLCLVLKFPTRQIQQRFPSVESFTFVDDRTLVSNSLAEVLGAKQAWQMWSDHLGMVENHDKDIHFQHTPKGRQKFLDHDIPAGKISTHPKLLGVELQGSQRRASTSREKERINSVLKCLHRARWLPIPWIKVKEFLATQALTKFAWGWMVRAPTKGETTKVQNAVSKALRESTSASVPLQHILRGHELHARFRVLSLNLGAAWRQSRKRSQSVPCRWSSRGWPGAMDGMLAECGWTSTEAWTWEHPDLQVSFSLKKGDPCWVEWPKLAHWLRESWRRVLFHQFVDSSRRDADACRYASYDEQVCKRARLGASSREHFHILSGAHVSPAAYCQMRRVDMAGACPCCNIVGAIPTLRHLIVDCVFIAPFRQRCFPNGVPALDPIEIRLGWPLHPAHADALLALHLHVRRHTLALRWGA